MNVKKMKAVYLGVIFVSLCVILTSIYYLLGGFEKVEVYDLEPVTRTVIGKYFRTRYDDEQLEAHIDRCRKLVIDKEIDGFFTVVNYQNDSLKGNEVEQFVGITLKQDMAEVPQDFEVREYRSNRRYGVFLSMHPIVMPRASSIEAMIFDRAGEDGNALENFFFEFTYVDNSVSVEGWMK